MTTIELEPAEIRPSPHNHRKKFEGIEELAASFEVHGPLSPIIVRPTVTDGDVPYELVVGERRWRAAKIAKIKLPAFVRDLTDAQVIEVQLIENVQRADIHPLEEADGYKDLLEKHGYDIPRIVDKTGKSYSTIRARLLLTKLIDKARDLFLGDRMTLDAAVRLARIPDAKLQAEAVKNLTGGWEFKEQGVQITGRQVTRLVEREFMLELDKAPFQTYDETLVAGVGACGPCPHRTGNQGELFSDIKGKDICTNPPCFAKKTHAQSERRIESAKNMGLKVLSKQETAKVFPYQNNQTAHHSGFMKLDSELGYELQGKVKGGAKTWRQALGKEAPPIVIAKDPNGIAVELVPTAAALAALKKAGKLQKPKASPSDKKAREKGKADRERRAAVSRATEIAIGVLVEKSLAAPLDMGPKATAFWRWIVATLAEHGATYDAMQLMRARRQDEDLELEQLAGKAKTALEFRALAIEVFASETAGHYSYLEGHEDDQFQVACRLFGVDWKSALALGATIVKPAAKLDDGNRCGLVHGKGDGCIHPLGHEGPHSDRKHTWNDPKPKKGKKP